MTNENTTPSTEEVVTISHRDAKLNDLREDLVAAQAKVTKIEERIAALSLEAENEQAIAELAPGSEVSYTYGRAANRRILSGVVRFVGTNDKGVVQLKVETGTGFDSEFNLIDASALLLTAEQIIAAQEAIDIVVAEARAAAEAAALEAATKEGAK